MKQGFLSQYFVSVAAKKLSAVEVDSDRSHQHEINGSQPLRRMLGEPDDKVSFSAHFIWFGEAEEGISADANMTWYDARQTHPTRTEYRLYFSVNGVMDLAREGDSMFIAKRPDQSLLILIAPAESTSENQLYWLFGLSRQMDFSFSSTDFGQKDVEVDFTVRFILDELGVDTGELETERLDELLGVFGGKFPATRDFSAFARKHLSEEVSPLEDPDLALMKWLNFEESLFRRLERHIVKDRIEKGFALERGVDVDGFLSFSLSVQNRRKARAGLSLENHFQVILNHHEIQYQRGAKTENKASPDFLFPGMLQYHNPSFPQEKLHMLGVKTSCKDRWRQVLSEAERIPVKHLLTLEPGISVNQTTEMRAKNLKLVLPEQIHATYEPEQRNWLMTVSDFLKIVKAGGQGISLFS